MPRVRIKNSKDLTVESYAHKGRERRNWHIGWIVLVVGLMISATVTLYMKSSVEGIAKRDFIFHCDEIHNVITNRLDDHARILLSGVALFNASDVVTREKWRIFNQSQKVEKQLPGIQGIGFSLLIPRAELTRHIQEIRSEGFPEYKLKPDGDREIYSSIIYLEPFSDRNLRAFGYDMLSEPVRREAMERARDTDSAALSGKVVLVQETGKEVQVGTLMYVPVYRKGMPTDSVEQRRAAIYGWVYSPYRMNDLMRGILGGRHLNKNLQFHLAVFDGEQPSPQSLLYEDDPAENEYFWTGARFTQQIPVDFNGHRWTLRFTQTVGGLMTVKYEMVWFTMVSCIIITLLLFFMICVLLNTRAEAQRMAQELTVDLRESEEKHRLLIENSHDIIYTITADGVFIFVSPAWTVLLGHPVSQVVGQPFQQFVHPDDIPGCMVWLQKVIETGQRQAGVEYRVRHADGSWYWHKSSAVPLRDEAGSVVGLEGIAHDITERKKADEEIRQAYKSLKETQSQLIQASKMSSLGQLAGGVAHEINNPLTGVLNNVQLIKMEAELKKDFSLKDFKELLDVIENSALRCKKITQSLLDFAHTAKGTLVSVSVNEIAEKTISLVNQELILQNIVFKKEFEKDIPFIQGDFQLLQQVIFGLITNAKWAIDKKLKDGGVITIKTSHNKQKRLVEIAISDNGIGISDENIVKLFTPFFTTKEVGEGTGLGLVLFYSIIKSHGGDIKVVSEVNIGTTFKISLPVIK